MLTKGQEIIYRQGGKILGNVNHVTLDALAQNEQNYIRQYQPFLQPCPEELRQLEHHKIPEEKLDTFILGTLYINLPNANIKTEINKVARWQRGVMLYHTEDGTFSIQYINIDLDKMLQDGRDNGVNKFDLVDLPPFPLLSQSA